MRSEDLGRDEGPELDLGVTPLSYPGSWLSVSRVVGVNQVADDLHVISHRRGPQALLRLTPVLDDRPVATDLRVTPRGLTWTHAESFVELTFDGPSKLRFRGAGLGLCVSAVDSGLTPFSGTYAFSDPAGGWVFSNYGTGLRYLITPLCGHGRLVGDQSLGRADRAVVMGDDGETPWEAELREARSGSAAKPPDAVTMDALQLTNRARFDTFSSAFGPMRDHPAGDLAAYVLWSSLVGSEGFIRRPAMLMSKNWMDKVWAWDPCFNALALARAHPDLAWDQFLVVFDHQDPATGAIPDSVTHSEVLFNFVKPPIHGWALRQVRAQLPEPMSEQRLSEAYTRLALWTRYWLDHRRAPGRMLPYYEHGNDSGWDNSTTFDRDRVVESPDLASFLIIQLDVLAELAAELGLSSDRQRDWEESREALTRALVDELWDGAHFVAKAVDSRRPSTATSLLNLLPLVIADRLPTHITEALTEQVSAHLTPWGLATELPTSALYEPDGYWRGPIWGPSTVLIECGLRLAGREDVAHAVRERFLALCEKSAFAENFDALHGTGLRDRAYTWTASSYIMYADDRDRADREADPTRGGTQMTIATDVAAVVARLREEVCRLHAELPRWELVVWTAGNVSARVPDRDLLVIKPSGVGYDQLSPAAMVVTDLEGNLVDGDSNPSSDTAAHAYVYRHLPHVGGVAHTHSTYATAWAARGEPIPCVLTMMADEFGGEIPIGPFALIGDDSIGRGIVETLVGQRSPAVLMRNHGVFTIGTTARRAVQAAVMCEDVARTVHIARQLGEPQPIAPDDIDSLYERYQNVYGQRPLPAGGAA